MFKRKPADPKTTSEYVSDAPDVQTLEGSLILRSATATVADRVAPALLDRTHIDKIAFSHGEWFRAWWVRGWPQVLSSEGWRNLIALPIQLRVSLFHDPTPPEEVRREIANQNTSANASRFLRARLQQDPSPALEHSAAMLKQEQIDVEISGNPLYFLTGVFGITATSAEQLEEHSQVLERAAVRLGLKLTRAAHEQDKGMFSLLPFNHNVMGNHLERNATVHALAPLLPFVSDEIVMKGGVYFGHAADGKVAIVDNFAFDNPHMVVIGKSGSGKSFWLKDHMEREMVLRGSRIYATDIEQEYELLCRDLGGQYVDLSMTTGERINVLDVNPHDPDGLAGAQVEFVSWLRSAIDEPITPAMRRALDLAYTRTFEKCGMRMNLTLSTEQVLALLADAAGSADVARMMLNECVPGQGMAMPGGGALHALKQGLYLLDNRHTLYGKPPLLSDLHASLVELIAAELDEGNVAGADAARVLRDILYPFALGSESVTWNCHTTVDVAGSPMVIFGLRDVPDALKPRRLKQIQLFTWKQYRADRSRKVEFVDEAWWLLDNPVTAQDLAARAARLRKYNVSLVLGTQRAEDFASSTHAQKVLQQAETSLIFAQTTRSIDSTRQIFHLSQPEADALMRPPVGSFLLVTKHARQMLRKHVAQDRHGLYSTRPAREAHKLA